MPDMRRLDPRTVLVSPSVLDLDPPDSGDGPAAALDPGAEVVESDGTLRITVGGRFHYVAPPGHWIFRGPTRDGTGG